MPRRRNGELPLPSGWEECRDYDGKVFYIDHNSCQTTWIDPRDRFTKPQTFADCVGDELPYGWEECCDPQIGLYYVDHKNQTNQLEDPRQQWRREQEHMLKEYLVTAQEDLEAKKEIFSVKEQRLLLAQDEYQHLNDTLTGWKSSHTSLNSNSSVGSSTKYDPDLLKADVNLARNRVARLKRELEQIRAEMQYKQQGLDTLHHVNEKMSSQDAGYSLSQAHDILREMREIQTYIFSGEREKLDLMQSLARLKEDFLANKNGGSSPDVSRLSLLHEKSTTASQTDLRGEFGLSGSRYLAEIARLRLQYDETRRTISDLKQKLVVVENELIPGQSESDKDRLLLLQEKEQLLRELRSIDPKKRSEEEIESVQQRIQQLEFDLKHAKEISSKQIAERLKCQERKTAILKELSETTVLATTLESQLKSMSLSTLSMSSGSSLGSLGSLSASSRGSLSSLNMMDIYGQQQTSDINLQDLHRRVEKLLQGHGISPIHENPISIPAEVTAAATGSYLQSVMASSNQDLSSFKSLSPHSSLSSLSPPISPYDIGPPPTYAQHMTGVERHKRVSVGPPPVSSSVNSFHSNQSKVGTEALLQQSKVESLRTNLGVSTPFDGQSVVPNDISESPYQNVAKRTPCADNLDGSSNPPLSPISESSSGVCNNLSGGNTRSVSAAVSDESVAGDSGVFEASMKRDALDEALEMNLESAQIQIKLKFEGLDGTLLVGIEQARNLAALQFPEGAKVCIKAALLPHPNSFWETQPSSDLRNPKFAEMFRVAIQERKLVNKTLQVNIWCLLLGQQDECYGCAQVSLADFDPKEVSIRWYNVLSFKFMQSDHTMQSSVSSDSSIQENGERSNTALPAQTVTEIGQKENKDKVAQLLEASSARLQKVPTSSEGRSSPGDGAKESHFKSHPTVSSLKEESSDESTIISSQTSTLTRNQ
ncbi:hypothetical protein CHS0354_035497, partial [Potamilus streckersoni]